MKALAGRFAGALLAGLLPVLAACTSPAAAPLAQPKEPAATSAGGAASTAARGAPTATAVPPTPTAVPMPTPVPEPHTYLTASGGQYFAETGFTVQDEPGGPRFWTEYQRLGGTNALGLPTSRVFDGPDGSHVQTFQKSWLSGKPGAVAVQRGEGQPPEAPADAKAREDRPEMAFIGRVDVQPKQVRQGSTVVLRIWSQVVQSATVRVEG